jgi:hypothetical protein
LPVGRLIILALVATVFAGVAPGPRALQPWEHGGVQLQLGRVRMLTERLSKQNLLYQLNLAGQQRRNLVETAGQIDATLSVLEEGSLSLSVPAPPTLEIRRQIEALDATWGALRHTAVASPYEYVRRAAKRGVSDPLGIQHFDRLAGELDQQATRVSAVYVDLCEQQARTDCRAVASAISSGMLTERMLKELVLVVAGMDATANETRLRTSRDGFDRTLAVVGKQEPVRAAMSPERGKPGVVVSGMWRQIHDTWQLLRGDVDKALAGKGQEIDLANALARQHSLLSELQRLSVAVRRFAAERRIAQAGPPS